MIEIYIVMAAWLIPMLLTLYFTIIYFTSYYTDTNKTVKRKYTGWTYIWRFTFCLIPIVNIIYAINIIEDAINNQEYIDCWLFREY